MSTSESTLSCSQELYTGLYSQPAESSQFSTKLFISGPFLVLYSWPRLGLLSDLLLSSLKLKFL
jgi:hypothetical protein